MSKAVVLEDQYSSEGKNFIKLTIHCALKGVQLGSVVGIAVVTPIMAFVKSRANKKLDLTQFAKYQVYSLAAGVGLSLAMMMGKYVSWQNKKECLRDRAYRIDRNVNQNRVDEITIGAFLASGLVALVMTRSLVTSIGMTTPGVVGGLLYHVATAIKPQLAKESITELQKQTKELIS